MPRTTSRPNCLHDNRPLPLVVAVDVLVDVLVCVLAELVVFVDVVVEVVARVVVAVVVAVTVWELVCEVVGELVCVLAELVVRDVVVGALVASWSVGASVELAQAGTGHACDVTDTPYAPGNPAGVGNTVTSTSFPVSVTACSPQAKPKQTNPNNAWAIKK